MLKYIFLLLTFATCVSQQIYEPQILVLGPNSTKYEKSFTKEIKEYNAEIQKSLNVSEQQNFLKSAEFEELEENFKIMTKSEIEFSENLDFFKYVSATSAKYLTYRFYEKFPKLLVKLKDVKSKGTIPDLKAQSEKEKLQYVLNYPSIEFYETHKIKYAKIHFQLYDSASNSLIIDKTYIGDWNNPGFEFSCDDKTITCTVNNALSKGLSDVISTIASNSPTLKLEKLLQQDRFDILIEKYFDKSFDKNLLSQIITVNDNDINLERAYQALYNDDKTKMVAFFMEKVEKQNFKTFKDSKKDKNVQIISDKGIQDEGFFDDIPSTYAYIVKAVKHSGKWYYEKSNVTYFNASNLLEGQQNFFNNLQKWNFFNESSTEYNSSFWDTNLFAKVQDLKLDPQWKNYGESIWKTKEINNRPYIGLHEIVARQMQNQNEEENKKISKLKRQEFLKIYDQLKLEKPEIYRHINEHSLIFPSDQSVVINPVLITDKNGIKTIHYFIMVADASTVYEWTYFSPQTADDDLFGNSVVEKIGSLTDWNFSADNLNDKEFWNKYILQKSGNGYKYLKKVK